MHLSRFFWSFFLRTAADSFLGLPLLYLSPNCPVSSVFLKKTVKIFAQCCMWDLPSWSAEWYCSTMCNTVLPYNSYYSKYSIASPQGSIRKSYHFLKYSFNVCFNIKKSSFIMFACKTSEKSQFPEVVFASSTESSSTEYQTLIREKELLGWNASFETEQLLFSVLHR